MDTYPNQESNSMGCLITCVYIFFIISAITYLLPYTIISLPTSYILYLLFKKKYKNIAFFKILITVVSTLLIFTLSTIMILFLYTKILDSFSEHTMVEKYFSLTIYYISFAGILLLGTFISSKAFQIQMHSLSSLAIGFKKSYAYTSFFILPCSFVFILIGFLLFYYFYLQNHISLNQILLMFNLGNDYK